MPNLNTSIMSEIPFVLPPLSDQRHIANILGTLDDKIELNRRMNQTLEKMAAALFKSWFIDFDPVHAKAEHRDPNLPADIANLFPDTFQDSELGPIPKGWRVAPLSELAQLTAKTVKPNREPYKVWHHYSIPAFDDGQRPIFDKGDTIKSNKYAVPETAVLVSKLNPRFPRIWLPHVVDPSTAICSTEFMPFVPLHETWRPYVYALMTSSEMQTKIKSHVTGSTGSRQRVKPKEIAAMQVVVPPDDVIDAFCGILEPFQQQLLGNRAEGDSLSKLRETLLPKLLSGELAVSEADDVMEANA